MAARDNAPALTAFPSARSAKRQKYQTCSTCRLSPSTGCWATKRSVASGRDRAAALIFRLPRSREIFEEISPIEDFSGQMSLSFREHRFEEPKYTGAVPRKDLTYSQPLFVTAEFFNSRPVRSSRRRCSWATSRSRPTRERSS